MCDQQSLRPACAYSQSDQSLCFVLEYSMTVQLLAEQHLEFLSFTGGCACSSESVHVKMPHCWKSHVVAQIPYISDLSSALLSQGKGASFVPSPATGVLSPFSEEIIEISGYSDMWGVYTDNLICRVSSYIHTRCYLPFQ